MAEAARRAATLDQPTWIMARHQTAARGRRGRAWQVPTGNLSATLVSRPIAMSPIAAAQRSFVAANALYLALATHVDQGALALKWPNDVLLSGGKIAGILLESASAGAHVDWLSIGIGVNLAQAPEALPGADFPPIGLQDSAGVAVTPEDFLITLAASYAAEETRLQTKGFGRIRDDWLAHAARLGEPITARTAREEITGVFEGVDADGNLLLVTARGRQVIMAADVYF